VFCAVLNIAKGIFINLAVQNLVWQPVQILVLLMMTAHCLCHGLTDLCEAGCVYSNGCILVSIFMMVSSGNWYIRYILLFILLLHSKYWLCHGSVSQLPACYSGGPGSILGQSMHDLW